MGFSQSYCTEVHSHSQSPLSPRGRTSVRKLKGGGGCWERFVDFAENRETVILNIKHWIMDSQPLLIMLAESNRHTYNAYWRKDKKTKTRVLLLQHNMVKAFWISHSGRKQRDGKMISNMFIYQNIFIFCDRKWNMFFSLVRSTSDPKTSCWWKLDRAVTTHWTVISQSFKNTTMEMNLHAKREREGSLINNPMATSP